MRVIAGEFRSRKLKALPGLATRPTPDRLREALFNVLAPRLADTVFLDLYAGTGAVGIEALSRGARRAIFVERSRAAAQVIRDNVQALGLEGRAEVFTSKPAPVLERISGGEIVFLDPPYEMPSEYETTMGLLAAGESKLVVVQHASRAPLDPQYGRLRRFRILKQGDNSLSFYE